MRAAANRQLTPFPLDWQVVFHMPGRLRILIALSLVLACRSAFGWGGGGCFLPETPVLLADGSRIPISAVEPGMRVLAFNGGGKFLETVVEEIYCREVRGYLVIETSTRSVRVTGEHPFFDGSGGFHPAGHLKVGDAWWVLEGDQLLAEQITAI